MVIAWSIYRMSKIYFGSKISLPISNWTRPIQTKNLKIWDFNNHPSQILFFYIYIMSKERLLAYTDAVLAIVITIMVLEFKIPHSADRHILWEMRFIFLSYLLSFVYLTIYRNNHHHMFHAIHHVNSGVLWANSGLLFFLSLVPFASGWMAENHFASSTVIVYGCILLCSAISYYIITQLLIKQEGKDSMFAHLIDKDRKWKISLILYIIGTLSAIWYGTIWLVAFAIVAIMRLIPDQRMERVVKWK